MNNYLRNLKIIVPKLGKFLGILGLAFVVYKLSQEYTINTFMEKFHNIEYKLIYLFILNFISLLLGIYAWHIMLLNYSKKKFPYIVSYYYYTKTEIAKYLPGNIFHFAGRQALASKIALTQINMAKISTFFSILLVIGTIITSEIFFISFEFKHYALIVFILSILIILIFIHIFYPSFTMKSKIYLGFTLSISTGLQGIILGLIIMFQMKNIDLRLIFQFISIYIISWLIGFITPGASGGLGVREAAFVKMITFFNLNIPNSIALFSILLVRLINIFVDISSFLSTFMLENKIQELENKR